VLRETVLGGVTLRCCVVRAPEQADSDPTRSALAAVAPLGADVTRIAFPHPRASVSHSGDITVAIWTSHHRALLGVGVDCEQRGSIDPRAARFYLTTAERARGSADDALRLRLWTVKEAMFKATPDNEWTALADLEVDDASAFAGCGRNRRRDDLHYTYATESFAEGWLTVAACFDSVLTLEPM
jgi:phosphopantetheinyl transferase